MAEISVDEIAQKAMALGLLTSEQLKEVWASLGTQNVERDRFIQALQRMGHLTKYQSDRLAAGETTGFYYGKYKVLYAIGAGTFARVFRAVHAETNEVAAIKVLRKRHAADPEAVNLFHREAELGMELQHPNIVRIYGCDQFQGSHYMVMEFIEGETLRHYVDTHKKVEYKIATRIATDICTGLDYAFKRSHLHRDMKLTNVMVSSSGKSLLLDFGLATDAGDKKDQKNQRAVDYAVLERLTRVPRDDKRSDIYFLGGMFYQMLSGVAPIGETKDRSKRLDQTRFRTVKPLHEIAPWVPAPLNFIVSKAMSLDPEKRYQSPAAMLVDLKLAVKKIEEAGGTERVSAKEDRASVSSLSLAHDAKKKSGVQVVCVVESNSELQDSFRNYFKKMGYRVLVFSTVKRVLDRLEETDTKIDCVIFNAQSLGKEAVLGFNTLGRNESTKDIPALLLLDEKQAKWGAKAERTKWRVIVGMPVKMNRICKVVGKLIDDKQTVREDSLLLSAAAKSDVPQQSSSKIHSLSQKGGASKLALKQKETHNDAVLEDADLDINTVPVLSRSSEDTASSSELGIETSCYDAALAENTDSMAVHLEEILTERKMNPERDSSPSKKADLLAPYPDDEEFFFDYITDRDL